jgi:predicted small secreted protein
VTLRPNHGSRAQAAQGLDLIGKLAEPFKEQHLALEVKMKKKMLLLWALLLIVLTLEGCATIRGIGEDIQSLGRAVKRAFSE